MRIKRKTPIIGLVAAVLIVAGIAAPAPGRGPMPLDPPTIAPGPKTSYSSPTDWASQMLGSMSLDEKIGQLIIPATVGMFLPQDGDTFQDMKRNVVDFHVGGYHMLGDLTSGQDPAGVALLVNHLQELAKIPLWITADFEGGVGIRYRGATRLPRGMAIGATGSEEMAFRAGQITGEEARAMGVDVNFYPVVDVNNNPANPIINIRSFGSEPAFVGRMARAYIRGSQGAHEMATAKHFPGHGDTSTDSHLELPVLTYDRARLDRVELPPFRDAIAEQVGGVMSAHIALPTIDPGQTPATLSRKMLTTILRGDLRFQGVVFTDAMVMKGIADHYPEGEAAVLAIKAGADVVLYPGSVAETFAALKKAVETGDITAMRIDDSVRRILTAKATLGLNESRLVDLKHLDQVLGSAAHQREARGIIESALTLVRDRRTLLPFKIDQAQHVLLISMLDNNEGWADYSPGKTFLAGVASRHPQVTSVRVSDATSPAEFDLIAKMASTADAVVVNAFVRVAAFKGTISLSEKQMNLLKQVSVLRKPVVLTIFGSPYLASAVPEMGTCVLVYEYYPEAEDAAVRAIFGEIPFKGKLPVSLQ